MSHKSAPSVVSTIGIDLGRNSSILSVSCGSKSILAAPLQSTDAC
jgi:hypothetical protein